jgi:ferrochelatase
LQEVAEHYLAHGGASPINAQNRALIAALEAELAEHGPHLPVYFGNRNWHPLLTDTLRAMVTDGVRRAVAVVTSPYSSYSSCRQYLEDIARARAEVGSGAPRVDKLRAFFNHPGFVEANVDAVRAAFATIPPEHRDDAHLLFTAHSIPLSMARGAEYEAQLLETSRLVAEAAGHARWRLVYQSRSGRPQDPWLEPDIGDALTALAGEGAREVVISPIGFISDHMEVLYDLDVEARALSDELGLTMVRAATAGLHPAFVRTIRELIAERMSANSVRRALGTRGTGHDTCRSDCCPLGR